MNESDDFTAGLKSFLDRAAEKPVLSAEQEVLLGKRKDKGDRQAHQLLIEHNILLVVSVAKKYRNKGVPFEDLVQEGMIGLDRAVKKWDWERGFKFSTYAVWWIQHFVHRCVQNMSTTIKAPNHVSVSRGKIFHALTENPDLSYEELAEIGNCKVADVEALMHIARVVASLDQTVNSGMRDGTLLDTLSADMEWYDDIEDVVERRRVQKAVEALPQFEREVIELRFGFRGDVYSRDDIAQLLSTSTQAVIRAQKAGLMQLREALAW